MSAWLARVESVLEQVDSAVGTGASGRASAASTPRSISPQNSSRAPYSVTPLARTSGGVMDNTGSALKVSDDEQAKLISELIMRVRSLELDRESQEELVLALRQKLDQTLREKNTEAAAQAADEKERNEEVRALEDRIASLEGELQAYSEALGTANSQAQQSKETAEALKAECTEHVAAAAKASAEIARLQGALHIAQAQVAQAHEEAEARKSKNEETEAEADVEGSKLSVAANKLAKDSKTGDKADIETITHSMSEVVSAAVELLGADVVRGIGCGYGRKIQ